MKNPNQDPLLLMKKHGVTKGKGNLTPQSVYEEWLLHVLWVQFEGSASKSQATAATINAMKSRGLLTTDDFKPVSKGEPRAENTIAWGRNSLKDKGLISHHSRRGVWELTEEGIKKAKTIHPKGL